MSGYPEEERHLHTFLWGPLQAGKPPGRLGAWRTRWLPVPYRVPATPGLDLLFVRCPGEEEYDSCFMSLFGKFCREDDLSPTVHLVAFPRPFGCWYRVVNPAPWGDNAVKEGRLRWRSPINFFHMWHTTEFLSVPTSDLGRLYPPLPTGWSTLEAPEHLCVPTSSVLAYISAR